MVLFSTAFGARTFALLIGVGEFDDPKISELPGAIQDVEQLGALFERLGIASRDDGSLQLLLNPTANNLYTAIFSWAQQGESGDRMILYFGGHAETLGGQSQAKTYLVPRDGYSDPQLLARTCVEFQKELVPLFQDYLQQKHTLLILDACYSGSILGERPISDPRLELNSFSDLAERWGIQVLVSANGDEFSKEKPGGGGYFTAALIEGLSGEANSDGDETIEMGELGTYVERVVKTWTANEQNPVYFGKEPEMVVALDPARTTNELKKMMMDLFAEGKIPQEHILEYGKILGQLASEDTPNQKEIRKFLEHYYQVRDLETLTTKTQQTLEVEKTPFPSSNVVFAEATPTSTPVSTSPLAETPTPVEELPRAQRNGTCFLKIFTSEDSAETEGEIHVWVDGEYVGLLGGEGVSVENLEVGNHEVVIDGPLIETTKESVNLKQAYSLETVEVKLRKATRGLIIFTRPVLAQAWINGILQQERTPFKVDLLVGQSSLLALEKEGYNRLEIQLVVEEKGVPEIKEFQLQRNLPPEMPIRIGTVTELPQKGIQLRWMAEDADDETLLFDVFIKQGEEWEQVGQELTHPEISLGELAFGREYKWKVVVKDPHGNETEGVEWSFRTPDLPLKHTVCFGSDPEGAQIFVDGESRGFSPVCVDLEWGTHEIQASLDGYYDEKRAISLDRMDQAVESNNHRVEEFFSLRPRRGVVNITTNPDDASIFINGVLRGTSSFTYEGPPGEISVEVKKEGFRSENRRVMVDSETPKSELFELHQNMQHIRIESAPVGAQIMVDGKNMGNSPMVVELGVGEHVIQASASGYHSEEKKISIDLEENSSKDFRREWVEQLVLQRIQGTVSITTVPSGASIYVNGIYKGMGSFIYEGAAGTITVDVKLAGYESETRSLTVIEGRTKREWISLKKTGTPSSLRTIPEGMVLAKAGTFQMGNTVNSSEGDRDETVHQVRLKYDFLVGKYEVTFSEFDAYCEATGIPKPSDRGWGRDNRPVINVNWWDAIRYCNWLSESEGFAKAYDEDGYLLDRSGRKTEDITKVEGYRLLTEAEWEYAARGGQKSTNDFKYSGSHFLDSVGWFDSNSDTGKGIQTHPVGQKKGNELGLFDMSGNVWEWCHDGWGSDWYTKGDFVNPIGPETKSRHVERGGSWLSSAKDCRLANRVSIGAEEKFNSLGFRIARTY